MVYVTVDMSVFTIVPVVGELSTEDPHLVGYVSDTITLPCEHTVAKADLEAVLWRKDTDMIVAEYDVGDDPPVAFYESMEGRGSAKVFPPTLTFSSASLEDAGVYQCEVLPLEDQAIVHRYTLTVNGRELLYLETLQFSFVTCNLKVIICLVAELREMGLSWGQAQASAKDRTLWQKIVVALCPTGDEEDK